MNERLETKATFGVDDAGTITGTAWPFGTPDRVGDMIEKGAFRFPSSLPILAEHDQRQVIGVWESAEETDTGLIVKGRLFVEGVEPARKARERIRNGNVGGLSIAFKHDGGERLPSGGRRFRMVDVTEISICRQPVHPGARITEMKSEPFSDQETPMENAVQNEPETNEGAAELKAFTDSVTKLTARLEKVETRLSRPNLANDNRREADVELKAFGDFLRTGNKLELKAAVSGNDPGGGYLVVPTVETQLRTLLTDVSPMRSLAEVVGIDTGSYERFYSKGKRGAQWVTENGDRPQDTARPELIKHAYGVAELYAAPATTRQMLDDARIDIATWLINNAAQDFAETEGEAFLTGAGIDGAPKGLLTYPTAAEKDFTRAWGSFQYVPAGHASAPTATQLSDALIKLVATLRRPYRGNAVFLMNSATAVAIRQIKDLEGRYLWAPTGNLIEGVEHPLLGQRVVIDEGMPDIGAGTHPIAFGDFHQGYVIVDRDGIRTEIDAVTQKGRVIFDTYKRVGGGAGDFNAIKFLKIAAS